MHGKREYENAIQEVLAGKMDVVLAVLIVCKHCELGRSPELERLLESDISKNCSNALYYAGKMGFRWPVFEQALLSGRAKVAPCTYSHYITHAGFGAVCLEYGIGPMKPVFLASFREAGVKDYLTDE